MSFFFKLASSGICNIYLARMKSFIMIVLLLIYENINFLIKVNIIENFVLFNYALGTA